MPLIPPNADPEETGPILAELRGIRTDLQETTKVVEEERIGRRQSIRLTRVAVLALAFTVLVLLIGGGVAVVRYIEATQITCESRTQSRSDIRAGIEAAADEVADYAQVPAAERAELNGRVAARVQEKVGPPDC